MQVTAKNLNILPIFHFAGFCDERQRFIDIQRVPDDILQMVFFRQNIWDVIYITGIEASIDQRWRASGYTMVTGTLYCNNP